MPSGATVTAYAGPGHLASGLVLTNVTDFEIETEREVLRIVSNGKQLFFALTGSNTFTLTVTAGVYSLTVA